MNFCGVTFFIMLALLCAVVQGARATDVVLSGSDSYTAQDGDVLHGNMPYVYTQKEPEPLCKNIVNSLTPEKIATFLKGLVGAGNHTGVVMTPKK